MLQLFLSRRMELVAGARVERSRVTATTQPTIGAEVTTRPDYTDVLPSLALNLSLSESHLLRFAASQTLSRPEYRELSPLQYREVLGGDNVLGNPDLRRALVRNFDLRWEWYPRAGEVVSVAAFAKQFDDPIEQVYLATSGTRIITYLNAESARNYGVEVEVRKNLGFVSPALLPWSVLANATLMSSRISTGDCEPVSLPTCQPVSRSMVGQAPYVVNGGLLYVGSSGWSGSVLYNLVGRRIVSAGEPPLPDAYEEARHGLDLSIRFPVLRGLLARVDAENLLDPATRITQGSVLREYYKTGRRLNLGLTWSPLRPQ
jgi:TonB-dependent receptor